MNFSHKKIAEHGHKQAWYSQSLEASTGIRLVLQGPEKLYDIQPYKAMISPHGKYNAKMFSSPHYAVGKQN